MGEQHQFNRQKLKSAIHHICTSVDPADLGKVKLHKILYFADMLHYLENGRPLTGVEYQKQQFGPVAKHLTWALDDLAREDKVVTRRILHFGVPTFRFEVVSPPLVGALSPHETALLDEVAAFVCARSARAISELSHNAAWDAVEIGDTIPYYSAFLLVPCEITDDDVAWGESEARRLFRAA